MNKWTKEKKQIYKQYCGECNWVKRRQRLPIEVKKLKGEKKKEHSFTDTDIEQITNPNENERRKERRNQRIKKIACLSSRRHFLHLDYNCVVVVMVVVRQHRFVLTEAFWQSRITVCIVHGRVVLFSAHRA